MTPGAAIGAFAGVEVTADLHLLFGRHVQRGNVQRTQFRRNRSQYQLLGELGDPPDLDRCAKLFLMYRSCFSRL